MLSKSLILSLFASSVAAAGVTGTPFGFAAATTGGGSAEPVYPTTVEELTTYLTDDEARVIILNKEFNFIGTEGEKTENGCRPDSNTCPDDGGQDAINGANWVSGPFKTHEFALTTYSAPTPTTPVSRSPTTPQLLLLSMSRATNPSLVKAPRV